MKRTRQQELFKRSRAGRKRTGKAGVPHRARSFISGKHPLHVTIKVVRDLPGLRTRHMWKAVAWALAITVQRPDFRICHVSIQGNHIHLIVEAETRVALSRGMQGFQISLAKQINARVIVHGRRRKGRVFADRYHAEILDGPRRVRRALAYVLNNWRRHRMDRGSRLPLDLFSTGHVFDGWAELQDRLVIPWDRPLLPVSVPTTWLLTTGWKRGGGLLSVHDIPGPRA